MAPPSFRRSKGGPRIWIHAVSLGEVKVAASLWKALEQRLPQCSLFISTTTPHGRQMAEEMFGDAVPIAYAPLDFLGCVRKSLSHVRPQAMVFLETEIWPSWVAEARRRGIKIALVNGRISPRSIQGYLKLRPFFREVLRNFDAFSMILKEDAERIQAMGADPAKIEINGNAKYDLLAGAAEPQIEHQMRRLLNLGPQERVFVAGSTREGEEAMILDVYEKILQKFPHALLIIVPRHIERTPAIGALLAKRGFSYQHLSRLKEGGERRQEKVVIVNVFGELFKIYSVGTLVFCGASLVPLGGQNPLEPAVWGKPVFYGPSMEDFLDAKALLEYEGGAVPVNGPGMLAEKALWFLEHPEALRALGDGARRAVLKNQDAAGRHARVIARLLEQGVRNDHRSRER